MTAAQDREITEIIYSQINALEALSNVIEEEYAALQTRDTDALLRIAATKERQLEELRRLESERRSATAALTAAQSLRLGELAARCRSGNAANGALAEAQRQNVTRLLRLLRGDTGTAAYGGDGRQKDHASSRMTLATA